MIEDYNRLPFKKILSIFQNFFFWVGFQTSGRGTLGFKFKNSRRWGVFCSFRGFWGVFVGAGRGIYEE